MACNMIDRWHAAWLTGGQPVQVASHAQKYFIRLNSLNKKDKRRSSIHDITSAGIPADLAGTPAPHQQGHMHVLPPINAGQSGPSATLRGAGG